MIMTVERSNPTVCAPTRRVPRPQGVRRRLAISVPPSPEERQQASVKRFRPTVPAIAIGGTGRPAFEAASRPGCCGGGRRGCPRASLPSHRIESKALQVLEEHVVPVVLGVSVPEHLRRAVDNTKPRDEM